MLVDPLHDAPPQLGPGLVHVRVRVRVAYPQLDDHCPIDHDVHPPLTAATRMYATTDMYIRITHTDIHD